MKEEILFNIERGKFSKLVLLREEIVVLYVIKGRI